MTAAPDALRKLADRVEQLQEPSREVDAEIMEAIGHKITWLPGGDIRNANGGPVIHWQKPHPYAGMKEPCPSLTASLDAAMALQREVLPGWSATVHSFPESAAADVYDGKLEVTRYYNGRSTIPACAVVAATLRGAAAKEAEGGSD